MNVIILPLAAKVFMEKYLSFKVFMDRLKFNCRVLPFTFQHVYTKYQVSKYLIKLSKPIFKSLLRCVNNLRGVL